MLAAARIRSFRFTDPPVKSAFIRCTSHRRLSTCIIGSGPAGFYVAQKLHKLVPGMRIDILERRPVPYGLVRFGVAPDHPEVKNVTTTFEKVAESEGVRFLGNVDVGRDISVHELRERYSAVVFAYGADQDKEFGIPGEGAAGVLSARSFVGWYNGDPEHRHLEPDLSCHTAVILGQGNVALDCARILLSPVEILARTDITQHALDALARSSVRRVVCVGRRGPLQAAFTIKELREMSKLHGCKVTFRDEDIALARAGLPEIKDRARKRLTQLMLDVHDASSSHANVNAEREFVVLFCRSPREFVAQNGRVAAVACNVTRLAGNGPEARAVATDETETLEGGLVLRSIGYQSVPIPGAPFDVKGNIIPNTAGVVRDQEQEGNVARMYCAGWVKRGPTGVILSTMNDAFETAESIAKDATEGLLSEPSHVDDVVEVVKQRGVTPVTFAGWRRIEQHEAEGGQHCGKPAEKMTDTAAMLRVAMGA